MRRAVLLLIVLAVPAFVHAVRSRLIELPPRWDPWAPLDVAEPPGLLTRFKLARLSTDGALCRTALSSAEMRYDALPDRATGPGCGFENAVRVSATSARLEKPFAASCRLAVSIALWERHVVQPAARGIFGREVARLEHFGSYSCRNVYGRETGRRSRHATADALDVAGFVLADGRRIRVAADWHGEGREARFLREVRDGACPYFAAVLGPDYNAAHRDHLHLDRGGFGICR
ncbi:MAG: extensin family protein [Thermodesulfobacteriota bacterium]